MATPVHSEQHDCGTDALVGLVIQRRVVSEEVLAGTELPEGGGIGRLYLTLHCHPPELLFYNMGSDVSQFNVSLIVRDSHKTVSTDYNL